MSSFDTNPFADPVDVNPFQDPSVTQLTNAPQGGLAEFNPFSETNAATTVPVSQMPGASQPAVLQPSVEPTQPTPQAVASAAQASLLRQQEELDRKAAELERKERELQNTVANLHVRENNWPPLPVWCPVKPCFYQDFSTEIPADYQRICKMLYYLWMLHSVTLFLNLLACLAWFLVDTSRGVDFGLSILWFVIFTPCAFLCWYRPIYKAFRSDNSFSFFVFFFVFFCQIGIYIIQLIGIPSLGDSQSRSVVTRDFDCSFLNNYDVGHLLCACIFSLEKCLFKLFSNLVFGLSVEFFIYSGCCIATCQWLDCSPVYDEAQLGCVGHHDGGGWLLHPLCRALTLPPEAGALPVPQDRGQLPAGPGGVFPGHLQ